MPLKIQFRSYSFGLFYDFIKMRINLLFLLHLSDMYLCPAIKNISGPEITPDFANT